MQLDTCGPGRIGELQADMEKTVFTLKNMPNENYVTKDPLYMEALKFAHDFHFRVIFFLDKCFGSENEIQDLEIIKDDE